MRTVFVTGGEGFTGSRLITYLANRGYEVVAGVRNRARKLAYERQGRKALVCDVADAINVARVVAGVDPDGIVHLAGPSRPQDLPGAPHENFQSIVNAWANILEAVRRTAPRAKVVLGSAGEVYGHAGVGNGPVSETTTPQPMDLFGAFKHTAEAVAHAYFRQFHLNVTIARPFHYTGAGQPSRSYYGGLAEWLVQAGSAPQGKRLSYPGLNCRRDVLHVQDVLTAYERLLQDGRPNEIYNICSGQALTCRELAEMMARQLGLNLDLAGATSEDAQPDLPVLWGNNSKLKTELGWHAAHTLQDAVGELAQSYRTALQPVAT